MRLVPASLVLEFELDDDKNEQKSRIELKRVAKINGIGFDGLALMSQNFKVAKAIMDVF
ncbi:hypothetical protein [Campylobacter mucosalis]|uniref:hypothetical protein n=1 Tax=Campylobacter mucosalis TaxID=202 RepID=UPI00146FD612|nr:hypothetical protein [Campylobacter mucosalis]